MADGRHFYEQLKNRYISATDRPILRKYGKLMLVTPTPIANEI